jgi:ribosomal protein S12 methylthiotransferase
VFGYSDEDGTDAERFDGKLSEDEIAGRVEHITALVDELMAQRAEDRIGESVEVLVEDAEEQNGRAMHQGPETDGITRLAGSLTTPVERGRFVPGVVIETEGVDLVADVKGAGW